MGKIFITIFIFFLHLSAFAQEARSVNCFHDLAMLTRIAQSAGEKEVMPIHDFYFFNSPRFVNKDLQVAVEPYGRTLLGGENRHIAVTGKEDQILHLFHEFDNTMFSDSYAAVAGIGVVNVRLMQLSNVGQFEFEKKSFALAAANGFKLPMLFQSFESGKHLVNVYQYMHGPNFMQIQSRYLKGEIPRETFLRVKREYDLLMDKFKTFSQSAEHRVFAADYGEMQLRPENVVYYDDQWYILEF